jgi:hypothetical protein
MNNRIEKGGSMRKILTLLVIIISLIVLAACSTDADTNTTVTQPQAISTPTAAPSAAPTEAARPESTASPVKGGGPSLKLSEVLTELTFCQQDESGSDCFASFDGSTIHKVESQYALHRQGMYLFFSFKDQGIENNSLLAGTITVDGAVNEGVKPTHTNVDGVVRYQLVVPKPSQTFSVQLGDLSPISFSWKTPLSYQAMSDNPNEPVLHLRGLDYGNRLMTADSVDRISLRFDEPMRTDVQYTPEGGQWLDDRRLVVDIRDTSINEPIRLPVLSQEGNHPPMWEESIHIIKTADRIWMDYGSGERSGWSPRDRFYDAIAFSPDNQRYVGIVELGPSQGDGNGFSYSFVVEEKDKEPRILENVFYSTVSQEGLPIRWMDNDRLLYASYFGAFVYDLKSNEKRALYSAEHGDGNVNFAGYDSFTKQTHILVMDDDYSEEKTSYVVKKMTFSDSSMIPKTVSQFAKTPFETKYSLAALEAIARPEGMYWTQFIDGRFYTVLEARDGSTKRAEGRPLLVSEHGVYLSRDGDSFTTAWSKRALWKPDGTIVPLPDKEGPSKRFGSFLVVQDSNSSADLYEVYDPDGHSWQSLSLSGNEPWVPNSGGRMLYRTRP